MMRPIAGLALGLALPVVVAAAAGQTVELDRARAIARAIAEAGPGDVVLIAGKGHETYQEIGAERRPFSDAGVAGAHLKEYRHASA